MIAMVISPGMYHAAPAYLPSTFAMYTTMLGFSAFMDWSGAIRTAEGITWFSIGAILGWPFAGALVLPFLAEEVIMSWLTGKTFEGLSRLLQGAMRSLVVLVSLIITTTDNADFHRPSKQALTQPSTRSLFVCR